MSILLDIVAVIQWVLYIYIIVAALYAIVRLLSGVSIDDVIESPLLGLKKMPLKSGFIVWLVQSAMFGVVALDMAGWIRDGINPLIQIL